MISLRNLITAGVVTLTLAAASVTATTPALAHGGGGHGGGGHGGGGAHFGGPGNFGGQRDGRFAFHDRNRLFFGDDDDYYPDYCWPEWRLDRYGHRVLVEVCS